MPQLWKLVVPAGLGLLVARLAGAGDLERSGTYLTVISTLLAVGLYGSTFGIDLGELRRDGRTVLTAVTVGVAVKAVLIGGVLALVWRDPLFLVLGVAVAQIDPLAVAAILDSPRMSARAKSILAAWSSFDDPVTVLLAVYAAALVANLRGAPVVGLGSTGSYLADLVANALFVAVAWVAWRLLRRWPAAVTGLAVALIALAAWRFTMLGLAVAGLFVRPPVDRLLRRAVTAALVGASFMLGLLLHEGVRVLAGISLGLAASAAQVVVGLLLTRRLPAVDRVHLAFAQQNGITAIILALLLETRFDGVVAVVAPAILVVNLVHAGANALVDRRVAGAPAGPVGSVEGEL